MTLPAETPDTQTTVPTPSPLSQITWATLPLRILQTVQAMFDKKLEFPGARVREVLAAWVAVFVLFSMGHTTDTPFLETLFIAVGIFFLLYLPLLVSSAVFRLKFTSGSLALSLLIGWFVRIIVTLVLAVPLHGAFANFVWLVVPLALTAPYLLRQNAPRRAIYTLLLALFLALALQPIVDQIYTAFHNTLQGA